MMLKCCMITHLQCLQSPQVQSVFNLNGDRCAIIGSLISSLLSPRESEKGAVGLAPGRNCSKRVRHLRC